MKEHKDYIDLCKGIGILLVVIGHGPLANFYISVFHMPLFFCITGLTFMAPAAEDYQTFFVKKINRILVPWVFFTIVSAIIESVVGRISEEPFNGPLWFLQTMFVAVIIYSILCICIQRKLLINVVCFSLPVIVFLLQVFLHANNYIPFGITRALEATFYIHFGLSIRQLDKMKCKSTIMLFILSTMIFIGGGTFSLKLYDTSRLSFVNGGAYTYNLLLSHITSIAGIIAVLSFSVLFKRVSFVNWLGKNSLVIMLVHFPLLEQLNQICFKIYATYDLSVMMKILITIPAYLITIAFGIGAVYFCRRYIPQFSGYSNLIPVK